MSRYKREPLDLKGEVSQSPTNKLLSFAALFTDHESPKYPSSYVPGQQVYVQCARGIDPKPYKIHEVLALGQYKLLRDGKIDDKIYRKGNLRTEPQNP